MNNVSSPFDKHKYEVKMESTDAYAFSPIDGIGSTEWSNIDHMARALHELIFVKSVLCRGISTKKGYFERTCKDAYDNLVEALMFAIIEVDERRKYRRDKGYSCGGKIQEMTESGKTMEEASQACAEEMLTGNQNQERD